MGAKLKYLRDIDIINGFCLVMFIMATVVSMV